ncbi:MAG: hypothetical protein ACQEQG_01435 [Bacillota bacterium]
MDFTLNQSGFMIIKVLYVTVLVTILFQFTLAVLLLNMELSKNFTLKIKHDALITSSIYAASFIKESVNFSTEPSNLIVHLLDETILEIEVEENSEGNWVLLKIDEEIVYNHYY